MRAEAWGRGVSWRSHGPPSSTSPPQQSTGRCPELRPSLRTRSPRAVCDTLHAVTLRILHPPARVVNRIEPCASQTLTQAMKYEQVGKLFRVLMAPVRAY